MKRVSNWTTEEDNLLIELYEQAGTFQKWKTISNILSEKGIYKKESECRERFVNKLNPELRQDKLETGEMEALFQYYNEYGPQWSVFETLIPGRSQNVLKNKFYSTLRALLRLLLVSSEKQKYLKINFSSNSLSSKKVIEIYEGKKAYRKFKGVLHSILKTVKYNLEADCHMIMSNEAGQQIGEMLIEEFVKDKEQKATVGCKLNNIRNKKIGKEKEFKEQEKPKNNNNASPENVQSKADMLSNSSQTLLPLETDFNPNSFFIMQSPHAFIIPTWNYPFGTINCHNQNE